MPPGGMARGGPHGAADVPPGPHEEHPGGGERHAVEALAPRSPGFSSRVVYLDVGERIRWTPWPSSTTQNAQESRVPGRIWSDDSTRSCLPTSTEGESVNQG